MGRLSLWNQNTGSLLNSWDTWAEEMDKLLSSESRSSGRLARQLACDISEKEDSFRLEFDMPGVDREHIDIQVDGNQLVVSASRSRKDEAEENNFHRIERSYGEYRRSFTLPENVNADEIEADYSNGVLSLTLPKVELAKPKKIKVGSKNQGHLKKVQNASVDRAEASNS